MRRGETPAASGGAKRIVVKVVADDPRNLLKNGGDVRKCPLPTPGGWDIWQDIASGEPAF